MLESEGSKMPSNTWTVAEHQSRITLLLKRSEAIICVHLGEFSSLAYMSVVTTISEG